MATKLDIKKLRREMVDFERGKVTSVTVTFNRERTDRFIEACKPASASEVLDYLMECVIRGSKVAKGKK